MDVRKQVTFHFFLKHTLHVLHLLLLFGIFFLELKDGANVLP